MPAATKSSAATFKQRPQCSDFDICCCFLLRWNAALVFWRESLNETDDRAPWDRYTTADWCHLCGPLSFRKLLVLVQDPVYSYSDCHIVRCKCHVMSYSVCKGPRLCWHPAGTGTCCPHTAALPPTETTGRGTLTPQQHQVKQVLEAVRLRKAAGPDGVLGKVVDTCTDQ